MAQTVRKATTSGNVITQPSESQPKVELPWSPASDLSDLHGLCMMLFSNPGVGKTLLATTMANAVDGAPMLVINFDEEIRTISDRDDIMVWPGRKQGGKVGSWLKAKAFMDGILTKKHPFKSICLDTLNSVYDKYILPPIQDEMGPRADGRQLYGKANDELLRYIRNFSAASREQGINVLFCCHAEEKQDGDSGPVYIRPAVTPGVIKGMYQSISTIGYLEPGRMKQPRKLILHPSQRITAKHHQPRSGTQLPDEIRNPDLGKLIDHIRGVKVYAESDET